MQKKNIETERPVFPFTAIIGQEEMKLALILNVIDPRIGGVMIMGDRGTGKSTTIRAVAERNSEIMLALGTRLAHRIRQMAKQRALLSLPNVAQRVCSQLWLMIPEPSQDSNKTVEIKNLPTHMEIAIMLNLSRETITRVFQQLQRNRIVARVGQNRLAIEDVPALQRIAEGIKKPDIVK